MLVVAPVGSTSEVPGWVGASGSGVPGNSSCFLDFEENYKEWLKSMGVGSKMRSQRVATDLCANPAQKWPRVVASRTDIRGDRMFHHVFTKSLQRSSYTAIADCRGEHLVARKICGDHGRRFVHRASPNISPRTEERRPRAAEAAAQAAACGAGSLRSLSMKVVATQPLEQAINGISSNVVKHRIPSKR